MPKLDEKRLAQQVDVCNEVKLLNLSKGTPDYSEDPHTFREDRIRVDLNDTVGNNLGYWHGNYQQFKLFCSMIRRISEPIRGEPWIRLGITKSEWEALDMYIRDLTQVEPRDALVRVAEYAKR